MYVGAKVAAAAVVAPRWRLLCCTPSSTSKLVSLLSASSSLALKSSRGPPQVDSARPSAPPSPVAAAGGFGHHACRSTPCRSNGCQFPTTSRDRTYYRPPWMFPNMHQWDSLAIREAAATVVSGRISAALGRRGRVKKRSCDQNVKSRTHNPRGWRRGVGGGRRGRRGSELLEVAATTDDPSRIFPKHSR